MATIPDVKLNPVSYTEIYGATGIAAGTSVKIQNKSSGHVYLQYNDEKPTDLNNDGFIVRELEVWTIPSGNQNLWLKGDGFIAVDAVII